MWGFVTVFIDSSLYSAALIKVSLCFITLWKVLLSYFMSWCHVSLDVDDLIFYMGAWLMTLGRPRFMPDSKENMWAQEFSSLASQILSFDTPLRKIQTNKPLLETKTPPPWKPKAYQTKTCKTPLRLSAASFEGRGKTESPSSPVINV